LEPQVRVLIWRSNRLNCFGDFKKKSLKPTKIGLAVFMTMCAQITDKFRTGSFVWGKPSLLVQRFPFFQRFLSLRYGLASLSSVRVTFPLHWPWRKKRLFFKNALHLIYYLKLKKLDIHILIY